jgi:hypothetical protein
MRINDVVHELNDSAVQYSLDPIPCAGGLAYKVSGWTRTGELRKGQVAFDGELAGSAPRALRSGLLAMRNAIKSGALRPGEAYCSDCGTPVHGGASDAVMTEHVMAQHERDT